MVGFQDPRLKITGTTSAAVPAGATLQLHGAFTNTGHIAGAKNIPIDQLEVRLDEVDPKRPVYVVCAK